MRSLFMFSFLFVISGSCFAQKHDYNWVMGYNGSPGGYFNMTLNFNTSPMSISLQDLNMSFDDYSVAFSDSSGSLLFYTNGIKIYNKNNQLMQNGNGINPGELWNSNEDSGYGGKSPFACYLPDSDSLLFLFHHSYAFDTSFLYIDKLYYTVINIKENGGLGKVVEKNNILMDDRLIFPTFTKHGNGRDWWIMCAKHNSSEQYLFLLTPSGISQPIIQDVGPPFVEEESEGDCTFSYLGSYYVRGDANPNGYGVRLFDFDRCTGILSNLRLLPQVSPFTPFFFQSSPDEQFLYMSRPGRVWSYDLNSLDIAATKDWRIQWEFNFYPAYPYSTGYWKQIIGPDGKLYWSSTGSNSLHVMHAPNLLGDACNLEENSLLLPKRYSLTLPQTPNYRLGRWLDSPCDTIITSGKPAPEGFVHTPYKIKSASKSTETPPTQASKGTAPVYTEKWHKHDHPNGWTYMRYLYKKTGVIPDDCPPMLRQLLEERASMIETEKE